MKRPDKYTGIRSVIVDLFNEVKQRYGVKRMWKALILRGYKIGRDVIRKIMKQENLKVIALTCKKYNSYKNDGNKPVKNWLYDEEAKLHFFNPSTTWQILSTDVTEFHVNDYKVYFSPIIDLHDNMVVSYKISKHPDMSLIYGSLTDLVAKSPKMARFILHSDQGSIYRTTAWKQTCKDNHILQSMSRKGESGDNAKVEGFFAKLKDEFFHGRDFSGVDAKSFMKLLEEYIVWYNEDRIMLGLDGGMSPLQYRKKHGYDLVA